MRKSFLALACCIWTYDPATAQDMPIRFYGAMPVARPGCVQLTQAMQRKFAVYKAARSASALSASGGGRTATTVLRVGITIGPPAAQPMAASAAAAAATFRSEQSSIRRAMMRRGCGATVTLRRASNMSASANVAKPFRSYRSVVVSMR